MGNILHPFLNCIDYCINVYEAEKVHEIVCNHNNSNSALNQNFVRSNENYTFDKTT